MIQEYSLREDFYALTFYRCIKLGRFEKRFTEKGNIFMDTPKKHEEFKKYIENEEKKVAKDIAYCFLIFLIQGALLYFSMYSILPEDKSVDDSRKETRTMTVSSEFTQLVLQFACIVILHIQLQGEVLQALNFINYGLYAQDISRKHSVWILIIALMQMSGALLTEFLNLVNIFSQESSKGIITELIAFGVIAEVDDFFAQGINSRLKQEAFDDNTKFMVQDDEVSISEELPV